MAYVDPRYLEHQRKRFTRNNAQLYIRHDAWRFAPPGSPLYSGKEVVRYFEPEPSLSSATRAEMAAPGAGGHDGDRESAHLAFRHEVSKLRLDFELLRFALKGHKGGFNPDQPRDDHGRWSDGGNSEGGPELSSSGAQDQLEVSAAKKLPAIVKEFGAWTVRQYASRKCGGIINRELPSQLDNITIADLFELKKGGSDAADKCYKLLNEPRFKKK